MKRQPIASAAAFFVLRIARAEFHSGRRNPVGKLQASTDCIFPPARVY